jgi:formylglycine-generating enzyme required for sulfatase activity
VRKLALVSRIHFSLVTIRIAGAFAAVATIAIVVQLALLERTAPVRCPAGLQSAGPRCCGVGQSLVLGRCEGRATSCARDQRYEDSPGLLAGCAFESLVIRLPGGRLPAGVVDWQGPATAKPLEVAPFAIDRGEVTVASYVDCARKGGCVALPDEREAGLPVTGVTPDDAEKYCRFAGGRLPTSAEWRFAASGVEGRRFPWGFTGLVCRRAAFGLVAGACGADAIGPDLVGARPDGATPDGVLDLAGNVSEWTRDPDGRVRARGGSFRSRVAAELMTAAVEQAVPGASYVGFRCAYGLGG